MSRSKCVLTRVLTKVLQDGKLPREQILLSSNTPKMPPTSTVSSLLNQTPPISELSKNKLPKKPTRSEPLCVFATLELTAKQLGCNSTEEINALGKQIVENSKKFLGIHKATDNYIWLCLRYTITEPYVIIALLMALYVLLFYLFGNITQISLLELVQSLIKERFSERQSHSSFVQNVLFNKCSR